MVNFIRTICCLVALCSTLLHALPRTNLGLSSFLDGGPLRPHPGLYYQQFVRYYTTGSLFNIPSQKSLNEQSPHFNALATSIQFIYQRRQSFIPHVQFGAVGGIPIVLYSHVTQNKFNILTSGSGFGNPAFGVFAQFDPIFVDEKPLFVHRVECDMFLPLGKNEEPTKLINPASNFFYINPYWAFTLYVAPWFALSGRLYYLWCARDHKTRVKFGDAIHCNYSFECAVRSDIWIGINGYFLQQIKDDQLRGISVPNSRERIFGIGAGILSFRLASHDIITSFNFYIERFAKNRPEGKSFVFRVLKHF